MIVRNAVNAAQKKEAGYLLVRIHVDMTFDAFLTHVSPRIPTHPFPFALGAFILAETALLALIWGQSLASGTRL